LKDKKFDIAAAVALVLSVGGAIWQVYLWKRGAEVRVIAPESFALYGQTDAAGEPMIRVGAPVSILNMADPPYGSAVVDEWAVLQLDDFKSVQHWNGTGSIERQGGATHVTSTGTAMPEALPAASGTSSFVLFASGPNGKRCGKSGPCDRSTAELRTGELLGRAPIGATLRLSLVYEDVNGKRGQASCSRDIDAGARQQLEQLPQTPAYLHCVRDG
jgi:hypothetical protein